MTLLIRRVGRRKGVLRLSPPGTLALMYTGLIATGTLLLKLPWAANAPTEWLTAFFTSASAATVTGLVLVDVGRHFSLFGQAVILLLIQLGGLGLMTFAVLVLTTFGLRIPLHQRLLLSEDLNHTDLGGLLGLVGLILRVVLIFELVGTALLAFTFVPELGWRAGLWHSLFHAVSAFNNAGFGLQPDNLSRWVADPVVNAVIPTLIILGGIGYAVLSDVWSKRRWSTLELHSKLMLVGTGGLIVWSVAAFLMLEWSNPGTIGGLGLPAKLLAGWFQAVTPRTAGFNTVDLAALEDSTALMMMTLMIIGGGSTSTAGGIKVTTFMVLILATIAFLKRRETVSVFGRRLGSEEVMKALALAMMTAAVLLVAIFAISITNRIPFLDLAFEVASALGTVGMSRGATTELDAFGQIVIVAVMFVGRVGPLTLGFFLGTGSSPRLRYPSSRVYLG